jgi:hypothetical protein
MKTDSTAIKRLFYSGEIGDDHGFKRLLFHYRFIEGGDSVPPTCAAACKRTFDRSAQHASGVLP